MTHKDIHLALIEAMESLDFELDMEAAELAKALELLDYFRICIEAQIREGGE
jgi:hypothetical protein